MERKFRIVKEWTTKAGLKAKVYQCVWSPEIRRAIATQHRQFMEAMPQYASTLMNMSPLPDHYTGYVEIPDADKHDYYDDRDVDVHGGVTYCGNQDGGESRWAGFDMAHVGDENIVDPENYAIGQCEKLAKIIKKRNKKK